MDAKARDVRVKAISKVEPEKEEGLKLIKEEDHESESLLPNQNGGISNGLSKTGRKVRWNDSIGNQLAEVLEFQPSAHSMIGHGTHIKCDCATSPVIEQALRERNAIFTFFLMKKGM
ncbi:hypothetical protein Ancab_013062 [Ancistrocladus abbreviatus]